MSTLVSTVHALRRRLDLPGRATDVQVLEIGIADGLFGGNELHEFMQSRQLLFDLKASKQRRPSSKHPVSTASVAMTLYEWQTLYSSCSGRGIAAPATVLESSEGRQMLDGVESALLFTLKESDQAKRWKQPLVRMLVILALATEDAGVDRVTSVLGAVVLTDHRRIEDFRARLESSGPSVLLLASCITCVVASSGLVR